MVKGLGFLLYRERMVKGIGYRVGCVVVGGHSIKGIGSILLCVAVGGGTVCKVKGLGSRVCSDVPACRSTVRQAARWGAAAPAATTNSWPPCPPTSTLQRPRHTGQPCASCPQGQGGAGPRVGRGTSTCTACARASGGRNAWWLPRRGYKTRPGHPWQPGVAGGCCWDQQPA